MPAKKIILEFNDKVAALRKKLDEESFLIRQWEILAVVVRGAIKRAHLVSQLIGVSVTLSFAAALLLSPEFVVAAIAVQGGGLVVLGRVLDRSSGPGVHPILDGLSLLWFLAVAPPHQSGSITTTSAVRGTGAAVRQRVRYERDRARSPIQTGAGGAVEIQGGQGFDDLFHRLVTIRRGLGLHALMDGVQPRRHLRPDRRE